MNTIAIFAVIWGAMIAHAFWEASVEGRNAWDRNKYGWKIIFAKNLSLTRYHFWLFFVYLPLIIVVLPLVIVGWNSQLFGILASAYLAGTVIEDFFWFVVNTDGTFKELWNPKFASYYPWLIIGKFRMPIFYLVGIGLSVLFWFIFAA